MLHNNTNSTIKLFSAPHRIWIDLPIIISSVDVENLTSCYLGKLFYKVIYIEENLY